MILSANPKMIGDTIGSDTIVIDTDTGAYYTLTPAASELWTAAQDDSVLVRDSGSAVAFHLVNEGILLSDFSPEKYPSQDASIAFSKIVSMADILLADPIHEVDDDGWPKLR